MVPLRKLNLLQLEARETPSVAFSNNGQVTIIEQVGNVAPITHFQPFSDYNDDLNVAHVSRNSVAVSSEASSRVQVRIFNGSSYDTVFDQFTIEQNVPVDVALCDIDSDGDYDLIVGSSQVSSRTQIYLNDHNTFKLIKDYYAFPIEYNGGVNVQATSNLFAIFPETSGGPIAVIRDRYICFGNPDTRGISDWILGDTDFSGNPKVSLLIGNQLATFDLSGNQIYAATLATNYSSIGLGSHASLDHQGILATQGTFVDDVDPLFGNVYFYEQLGDHIVMGDSYDPEPGQNKDYFDPAKEHVETYVAGGDSIGSKETGTGTLTLKVIDNTDNKEVGLTNRHVAGQTVVTPGPADHPDHTLGILKRQGPLGQIDSALITLFNPNEVNNKIDVTFYNHYTNTYYSRPEITLSGLTDLNINDVVYKSGRTTHVTRGIVYDTDLSVDVKYHDGKLINYKHQNGIYSYSSLFSAPGDSGSPVFVYRNNKFYLAAQLFAGGAFTTIVTDIKDVFKIMNIRLGGDDE